jgi:O-acetyl-ADP-ribose deacetylase (regulator of RNase III)
MNIKLLKGDITKITIDVIVNAANTSLLGGGGVDGAIHRNGGPDILAECIKIRDKQGGCKTGEAVITSAGKLPCKKVIHTVGPVYNKGGANKIDLLRNCYLNSIKLLLNENLSSIAFPNISTGIYKFPKELAAKTAINAILELQQTENLKEVVFVCYDDENYRIYNKLIKELPSSSFK